VTEHRDLDPNPLVWPECSACGTPYVYRRAMTFGGDPPKLAPAWTWQRDCQRPRSGPCKGTEPRVGGDPDAAVAQAEAKP
jgi:hypothetical protein